MEQRVHSKSQVELLDVDRVGGGLQGGPRIAGPACTASTPAVSAASLGSAFFSICDTGGVQGVVITQVWFRHITSYLSRMHACCFRRLPW